MASCNARRDLNTQLETCQRRSKAYKSLGAVSCSELQAIHLQSMNIHIIGHGSFRGLVCVYCDDEKLDEFQSAKRLGSLFTSVLLLLLLLS